MTELKRGYRLDDYQVLRESKALGPYPPWKGWRITLFKYLRTNNFGSINSEEEAVLHRRYILGRKHQKSKIEKDELESFKEQIVQENPQLFESLTFVRAYQFIERRTRRNSSNSSD